MTKSSESGEDDLNKPARPGVQCHKCGAHNRPAGNRCDACGAHLWIACHHCGHRNVRSAACCGECGRRLHQSLAKRWKKKLFKGNQRIPPWQIILLVLAVWLVYRLIVFLATFRLP